MSRFLMCKPDFYQISYEINPWMSKNRPVDKNLAKRQWEVLCEYIENSGGIINWIEQAKDYPDMVFTANAGLIYKNKVILSNFKHKERRGEKEFFKAWFKREPEWDIHELPEDVCFEGAGDALFQDDILFAGYGQRTDKKAYEYIKDILGLKEENIYYCNLINNMFYHLDTCMCPLSNGKIIIHPSAFSSQSWDKIRHGFRAKLIVTSESEASYFACNSVSIGNRLLMPGNCKNVAMSVSATGIEIVQVPMGEFIKAGGAVKCLTLQLD